MSRTGQRPRFSVTDAERRHLLEISRSTVSPRHALRAALLLAYADGEAISAISRRLGLSRPTVQRSIDRAHEMGLFESLEDRQRSGRPRRITDEACAWLVELARSDPRELGLDVPYWTMGLLSEHARKECRRNGHPSLAQVTQGTVSRILMRNGVDRQDLRRRGTIAKRKVSDEE